MRLNRETVDLFDETPMSSGTKALRDQFSMAVLAGITEILSYDPAVVAQGAYAIADAMLAERAKK